MNNSIEEIRSILFSDKNKTIAVSAHTSPDGDAVGASCAIALAINDMGGKARVFLEEYSDTFNVIPTENIVEHTIDDFVPDIYVSVDCGDIERLGAFGESYNKAQLRVNIDHHKSNTYFGMINYADEYASSAREVIYRIISPMFGEFKNPDSIAGCLYAGIVFDTGGFRHTSTSSQTLRIASELIKYKFDFNKIYNTIFNTRKFSEAKALGKALENMKRCSCDRIVYSSMTLDEMSRCGTDSDGLSEIVNYMKGISGCQVSLFVYEKSKGVFKVSMRSEDTADVSVVCQIFGGGGHAKAAGCTISGDKEKITADIIEEIEKQFT